MLMNVQSIKRARSFYALSCTASPGGKHRGLAGSVAVLITESLLMLDPVYTETVVWVVPLTQTMQHPIYRSPPWRKSHEVLDYWFNGAVLFRAIPSTCFCRDPFNLNGNGLKGLDPRLAQLPASVITECLYTCVKLQVTQISGGTKN